MNDTPDPNDSNAPIALPDPLWTNPTEFYKGVKLAFIAVWDNLDMGRRVAANKSLFGTPLNGDLVFHRFALNTGVVFLYPEHTLTARQQTAFVHTLLTWHPEVRQAVIITSSPTILKDAMHAHHLKAWDRSRSDEYPNQGPYYARQVNAIFGLFPDAIADRWAEGTSYADETLDALCDRAWTTDELPKLERLIRESIGDVTARGDLRRIADMLRTEGQKGDICPIDTVP